ncbi:MAG: hypothetical protein V4525_00615 [Pseudomonadota bacterium]
MKTMSNLRLIIAFLLFLSASYVVAYPIILKDDLGRFVAVDSDGKRWISLAPHLTESFMAVGLENRLIAIDSNSPEVDSLSKLQRLSALIPHQPTLYRLNPTIIWVWYTSPASRLLALERSGVPVFYSMPRDLKAIPALIKQLKPFLPISSREEERMINAWESRIAVLQHHFAAKPIVKVFHPFAWQPLISFNRSHWLSEAFKICGAESVTDNLFLTSPLVKPKYILERQTDVIILAEKQSITMIKQRWQETVPLLKNIPIIIINPDIWHRPSPNLINGIEFICKQIDLFRLQNKTYN